MLCASGRWLDLNKPDSFEYRLMIADFFQLLKFISLLCDAPNVITSGRRGFALGTKTAEPC